VRAAESYGGLKWRDVDLEMAKSSSPPAWSASQGGR
jgi:hypothetical protein